MSRKRTESGQVLPLVTVLMVTAGLVCLAIGRMGGAAVARAQAVTAADAAALAGAAAGPDAAAEVAGANGGSLVDYAQDGRATEVRVRVGEAVAVARAERVPDVAGSADRGG